MDHRRGCRLSKKSVNAAADGLGWRHCLEQKKSEDGRFHGSGGVEGTKGRRILCRLKALPTCTKA